MKITLGRQIEEIKKKDSENEKNLLKNRNSDELNEVDADDIYFHSNTIKNIKLGSQLVYRIYLNNNIVYELEDTINLSLFHSLIPAATTTSITFDFPENYNIAELDYVDCIDDNGFIKVYTSSANNYIVLNPLKRFMYLNGGYQLFQNYTQLTNLNFTTAVRGVINNLDRTFYNCNKLEYLDLSNFEIRPRSKYMYWTFKNCSKLQNIKFPPISYTSVVEVVNGSFMNCSSLIELDLSGFDFSNVTAFNESFRISYGNGGLAKIIFNPTKLICNNLSSMYATFANLTNLTEIIGLEKLEGASNLSMREVFINCEKLKLLHLDSMHNAKTLYNTFDNCMSLKTIYSNSWGNASGDNVFRRCTSLVGGNGTTYNSSHANADYARVDGENGLPGYFTAPPANNK